MYFTNWVKYTLISDVTSGVLKGKGLLCADLHWLQCYSVQLGSGGSRTSWDREAVAQSLCLSRKFDFSCLKFHGSTFQGDSTEKKNINVAELHVVN